jgi:hypothetical protein
MGDPLKLLFKLAADQWKSKKPPHLPRWIDSRRLNTYKAE